MANLMRAEMLEELEACNPELKRMLAPIMLLGDSEISLAKKVGEVEMDRWEDGRTVYDTSGHVWYVWNCDFVSFKMGKMD